MSYENLNDVGIPLPWEEIVIYVECRVNYDWSLTEVISNPISGMILCACLR